MNGLVIAPHSSLNLWNELPIVMKSISKKSNLDGFTYVKSNKKLNFTEIFYINEKKLLSSTTEEEILNINGIISRDRWLRNFEHQIAVTICTNIYQILNKILIKKKYDFLIGEVSCATNEIAFYLSKKYNIPFFNITTSLYRNKYFLYKAVDIYGNKNFIKEKLKNQKYQTLSSILEVESEIITKLKNNKNNNSEKTYIYFKNLIYNLVKPQNNLFGDEHNTFLINLRALIRLNFNNDKKFYKNLNNVNLNQYFLYYLHYEPDLSTYIWSNNYLDQLNIIKIISNNLPFGTKLVVKEHPLSKLIRPSKFYKELNKINNVILIEANNNSYNLILNSLGVITLTGSVGYEAWLLGKPVIVFGNVFYDSFKNVFICKDLDTIFDTLCYFLSIKINKEELVIRNNIDNYISNECTEYGTIFSYENYFKTITSDEKLDNMQKVFNKILNILNEK